MHSAAAVQCVCFACFVTPQTKLLVCNLSSKMFLKMTSLTKQIETFYECRRRLLKNVWEDCRDDQETRIRKVLGPLHNLPRQRYFTAILYTCRRKSDFLLRRRLKNAFKKCSCQNGLDHTLGSKSPTRPVLRIGELRFCEMLCR